MKDLTIEARSGYVWLMCNAPSCGYAVECEGNTMEKLNLKAMQHTVTHTDISEAEKRIYSDRIHELMEILRERARIRS